MSTAKTNDNIIQNLQSKNEGIVLKAIDDLRNKGNEKTLPALLDLLVSTDNSLIHEAIKKVLFELKSSKAGDIIVEYLQNDKSKGHRDILISALWQSGIACEGYLTLLTELACNENYLCALEALTVIENMEGALNEEEVMECIYTVNEALSEGNDNEKNKLLESLVVVLEGIR